MQRILLLLVALIVLGMSATAQNKTFTREGLEYALDLPSPLWRAVARVDVHEHFEFINGDDYSNGYLRLRKKLVAVGTKPDSMFAEDEPWELQKLPGYVVCCSGKGTDFTGNLKGRVFSYEFVDGGSAMDGRIYYLQVDNRTFYVLHFTVAGKKLQGLQEQMDSMARSFRLKRTCID
jgi:hypothetical protein